MSERDARETDATLVRAESNASERALDGVIGLGAVSFVLGALSLVEVAPLAASGGRLLAFFVPFLATVLGAVGAVAVAAWLGVVAVPSRRARGIGAGVVVATVALTAVAAATDLRLATLLGLALVVEAGGIAAAGVVSRLGVVDTAPDPTAGLVAGVAFGAVGLACGAAIGGSVVGFDTPLWLAVALATGGGLGAVTVLPREDLGSTLPPALVVGALGLTIATAVVGVGWQYNPENLSGGFTGTTTIPLFVVFGALVSAWAGAKCRAGFGAQGREYGAFLVIDLNAVMMLLVMVSIVAFVTTKGVGYAFHGFTVGALSALVALAPPLVLAARLARTPATDERRLTAAGVVRLVPLAALGGLGALLASVPVTGDALVHAFTYTVYVNRDPVVLDTAVTVTTELAVGSLLLALSAGLLWWYFARQYGSLHDVGARTELVATVRRVVPVVAGGYLLLGVAFLAVVRPAGLPVAGSAARVLAALGAAGALALAVAPLAVVLSGRSPAGGRDDASALAGRVRESAPLFTLGLPWGLALTAAIVAFGALAGTAPVVGTTPLVPLVALLAALACAGLAVVTALARRASDERAVRRGLGDLVALALAGAAGFASLTGAGVWLAGRSLSVAGLTVSTGGTLSWPMTMRAYIPLGAEPGGIMPAVIGTIWLVVGASLFAIPLGVGAAVFLTEYAEQGRFTAVVEVATNALWSTPSIVFGLFGAAFLIPRLGGDTSLLAGQLVLGFMLLPLVLITSRESIKSVPDEYRDASAALGATRWQTVRSVVLPAAMPGVITGVVLGVGRIAGETAPLILVLGSTLNATESVDVLGGFRFVTHPPFVANEQLLSASAALPTQVWAVIAAGVSGSPSMGWASAFLLLVVVLTFYAVGIAARTYFRRKVDYE